MTTQDDRIKPTVTRPSTAELITQMEQATDQTPEQLYSTGIDMLHFVWSTLRSGGTVAIKLPNNPEYIPVYIVIPGMTPVPQD